MMSLKREGFLRPGKRNSCPFTIKLVKGTTSKGLVSIVLMVSISCAPSILPEVQVLPASQYALSQQKNGISLAIDPFFEKKRVKKYFKVNLLDDGILPIFVVVENQGDNLILIHPNDLISAFGGRDLSAAVGGIAKPESAIDKREKDEKDRKEGNQMATDIAFARGGLAGLLSSSISIAIAPIAGKDYEAVKYNLFKKMLLDKTLAKNDVTSGFVFLKDTDKFGFSKIQYLQLRVKNLKKNEMETFVYAIKSKGRK